MKEVTPDLSLTSFCYHIILCRLDNILKSKLVAWECCSSRRSKFCKVEASAPTFNKCPDLQYLPQFVIKFPHFVIPAPICDNQSCTDL